MSNLHYEVTEDRLEVIFGKCGKMHGVKIVWDRHDRSTGEAVVTFDNQRGAEEAIRSLNKSDVDG